MVAVAPRAAKGLALGRAGTLTTRMEEDTNAKPGPAEQVSRLYEDLEAQGARASEDLVGTAGFSALLARAAENAAALTKLSGDAMDVVLRNLRVAGRRDIVSLARQLARTEDKLERVLQEVEELRDELARAAGAGDGKPSRAGAGRSGAAAGRQSAGRSGAAAGRQSARSDGRAARAPARRRKDSS